MANANIVSWMRGRRKIRNKSGEISLPAVNYLSFGNITDVYFTNMHLPFCTVTHAVLYVVGTSR